MLFSFGGVAFFLVRKKRKEELATTKINASQQIPKPSPEQLPIAPVSSVEPVKAVTQLPVAPEILSNISVPHVDTDSRSFAYSMHYNGIEHNGTFEDGDEGVFIEKAFGSFEVIQQQDTATSKGAAQKRRGSSKIGTNEFAQNDWVKLIISDDEGVLRTLSINLTTGAQIGGLVGRGTDDN